jgi:hypothetical protein
VRQNSQGVLLISSIGSPIGCVGALLHCAYTLEQLLDINYLPETVDKN